MALPCKPRLRSSDNAQIPDNLTFIDGKHTFKFGGDYRYVTAYFSDVFAGSRASTYSFNNSVTSSLIGNASASFLPGVPDSSGIATVKNPDTSSYGNSYALYAQDDWKVTPRLAINYGLRWEYPAFNDHRNNLANFLPDYTSVVNGVTVRDTVEVPDSGLKYPNPHFAASITPTPIITALQAGIPQSVHYSLKTGFAPHIGFADGRLGDDKTLSAAGRAVAESEVGSYTNTIVNGKPTLSFPYAFPSNLSQPGLATFEYSGALHYALNYKDPRVQQWNLTVERDPGAGQADAVINPAAFAIPANNIGRSVIGPGTQAVSLSLFKTTRIAENANLQLGLAVSNAFNHPNYGSPALNLSSPSNFGTKTSLQNQENGGPRSLQLTGRITF